MLARGFSLALPTLTGRAAVRIGVRPGVLVPSAAMQKATRISLIVGAAVAGAALSLLTSDRWRRPAPAAGGGRRARGGHSGAPRRAALPDASGELRIVSNQTIQIDAASLVPGKPVVLRLVLGEPSRSQEPRPVRVLSLDSRVFEGQGILGSDLADARFEIDPAFLSTPGRYIVEVKTTEQSHFPLRRYALEVR